VGSLRSAIQRVRESLFFVPAAVILMSIVAAIAVGYVDRHVAAIDDAPLLLRVSPAGERAIATAVAGATITVAAIVFSITALSSQIASNQYSPRAVGGFFEDRFQQIVIGLIVGTFAFALLVVAGNAGIDDSETGVRGSLSATVAVILGIGSGVAIVAYIDHSLRRIRVGSVVRRIAEATARSVRREHRRRGRSSGSDGSTGQEGKPVSVRADRLGWVQSIDGSRLAGSLPPGSVARVEVRVGELVAVGDLLATVWLQPGSEEASPARLVRRVVHVGATRTIDRDPAFGIRQLVDIALRALSPGVNDPTTAVDVVQHLKIPLREILLSDAPDRIFSGDDLQRVFLPEAPSRSDHIHAAFSEIRLAATGQPAVLRAILEVSVDLLGELDEEDVAARGTALVEEARLTIDAAAGAGYPKPDLMRVLSAANDLVLPVVEAPPGEEVPPEPGSG
jgi:uncharacterized membrane protein